MQSVRSDPIRQLATARAARRDRGAGHRERIGLYAHFLALTQADTGFDWVIFARAGRAVFGERVCTRGRSG